MTAVVRPLTPAEAHDDPRPLRFGGLPRWLAATPVYYRHEASREELDRGLWVDRHSRWSAENSDADEYSRSGQVEASTGERLVWDLIWYGDDVVWLHLSRVPKVKGGSRQRMPSKFAVVRGGATEGGVKLVPVAVAFLVVEELEAATAGDWLSPKASPALADAIREVAEDVVAADGGDGELPGGGSLLAGLTDTERLRLRQVPSREGQALSKVGLARRWGLSDARVQQLLVRLRDLLRVTEVPGRGTPEKRYWRDPLPDERPDQEEAP